MGVAIKNQDSMLEDCEPLYIEIGSLRDNSTTPIVSAAAIAILRQPLTAVSAQ